MDDDFFLDVNPTPKKEVKKPKINIIKKADAKEEPQENIDDDGIDEIIIKKKHKKKTNNDIMKDNYPFLSIKEDEIKQKEQEDKIKEQEEIIKKLKEELEQKNKHLITYKGKNYIYSNQEELEKKIKLTGEQIAKINNVKYIINKDTGKIDKFALKGKPLILKEFGIKNITNAKLLSNSVSLKRKIGNKINNITIQDDFINYGNKINIIVELTQTDTYPSTENEWKHKTIFEYDGIINSRIEFEDYLRIKAEGFRHPNAYAHKVDGYIIYNKTGTEFKLTDMGLKDDKPLKISIFNDDIELIEDNTNCVKTLLKKKYKKISAKTIDALGDDNGVSTTQIKNFCKTYNIKMIAYDINKNIIDSFQPEKINKSYSALIYLAYNNHIYELENDYLTKSKPKPILNYEYVEELHKKFISFLRSRILPENIKLNGSDFTSFTVKNTLYHNNKDFDTVKEILDKLGLSDKFMPDLTLTNISDIIERLYIKTGINSIFPYFTNNSGGYNYYNDKIDDDDLRLTTIDQNKHYAYILKQLKYLLKCDIKTSKHIIKPKEILNDWIYIAQPKISNILMPSLDYYTGEHLIYCASEKVPFDVLEGLECERIDINYFSEMIDDLYNKLDEKTFKNIIVCMIGRFDNKELGAHKYTKFIKIANNDERERTPNTEYVKLTEEFSLMFNVYDLPNKFYSRKPIKMQIIEGSRKEVYEKMKELNLNENDNIKQIKTDAITYISTKKINDDKNLGGWKIQKDTLYFKEDKGYINNDITFEIEGINKNNELYEDYAGSGKTHYIINNLLPKLDDFICLSPSHSSLRSYRQNKINSQVIQYYTLNNKIPTENNIIVDEIGMCGGLAMDMLLKCALLGKNIYSFGDFKQLEPVNGKACNGSIFNKLMYGDKLFSLGTNYRNDFTTEYYDYLLNTKQITKLYKEIDKYNTKNYYEAEIIICFTNEKRQLYNKNMLEYNKLKWGDINTRICCKTNDLRDLNIYNNFYYTITGKEDNKIIIDDGIEQKRITEEQLNKYFEGGYCRTLYNIQGEACNTFFYPQDEYKFLDNRALYTLISRLKTK